jgi:hypothetical protein
MPSQQAITRARGLRQRFYRGVAAISACDPCYWIDDRGPDVVNVQAIIVGDRRWDVLAQRFASRAEAYDADGTPDPWLTGLEHLEIAPEDAADYGFADDPSGEMAQLWAVHIFTLRREQNARPLFHGAGERKPAHGMD